MSNAIDQSNVKKRKGKPVYGCLILGILYVFQTILYLITQPPTSNLTERVTIIILGLVAMVAIVGSIILIVKTRYISYGLWCNNCNKFVDRKRKRCMICGKKKLLWKRLPR